jgi:tRNA 2-thiouridine synthesizing protein A
VSCPYNFIKAKLELEAVEEGQVLSVVLNDWELIQNVPASLRNEEHTIVFQDRVERSYQVLISSAHPSG